ncbi:MAG: secretin N-terminal domain-containing protein [Burkholderiales bacterium]
MQSGIRQRFLESGGGYAAGAVLLAMLVAGCADIRPRVAPSAGHIAAPQIKPEPEKAIPPPARVSSFVPPPKPALKPQTYSVVVNEVPVKELLLALARDTKQNIDIHPGLSGLVSLNAIDETLPAILERISKQVNLRYRSEGNTFIVSPDAPYMKTYRVNYVNMTRNTTSTIGVSGQIAASGTAGAAGGSGTTGTPQTSASSTVVTTTLNNDFWTTLRDNIRAILASTRSQSRTAEEKAAHVEALKAAREERLAQAEAVARAGQAATSLFTTAFGSGGQPQLPGDVSSDVIVNPVGGTVSVLATERQHQLIQQHLDSIASASQRQVLIEATIVEVALAEGYQGGVDWSRVAVSGGITFTQALLGGFPAAASAAGAASGNAFTALYQNTSSPLGNINATIKLLQEFGDTRVLSSPKLMALNNQTALLKVVDNIVYFEVQAQTSTTQGVATTTFNTTPKTVSVGVVMGVTPQVNEDGRVSLTVRPTISRVLRFVNDPNPNLANPCGQTTPCPDRAVASPVPEIQTREMESVLQVGSGQTVILGGLMQDDIRRNREQLPGADRLETAGEAFRFRNERAAKTELVIFLRPTVISNPSLDSDELKFFQRFLPQPAPSAAEKTGAAQ